MEFGGWVKTSLLDFPGHIATVLFSAGCNFRCPMCHNADLVTNLAALTQTRDEEVFRYLQQRVGKVTGLVVTGGEPTLHSGLAAFLKAARELGYETKLDTNGYRPDALRDLLDAELIDMVAMDIKGPLAKYPIVAGVDEMDLDRIEASVALLAERARSWQRSIAVEFRTTVVPGLLNGDDIEEIARWLGDREGGNRVSYVLQQFRPLRTLDPALAGTTPYEAVTLQEMASRASKWLGDVSLRGL